MEGQRSQKTILIMERIKPTLEEINNGNELIARYMGVDIDFDLTCYRDSRSNMREYTDNCPKPNGLKFHNDWNWIMPVFDKIESMRLDFYVQSITFYSRSCLICTNIATKARELPINFRGEGDSRIEATWNALVQYCEWFLNSKYNEKETYDKSYSSNK